MQRFKSIRGLAAAALLLGTGILMSGPAMADQGIDVVLNQAKIVKLTRPADTIIIGNPEIADASVQDAKTIVLTGKGFGVTNMVILDVDGKPIVDKQIVVSRQTSEYVRVYRRASVQTLSCTPYCESSFKSEAERTSDAQLSPAP